MTTTYSFDDNLISDLHKDATGFRPTEGFWIRWKASTEDQKEQIWNDLYQALEAELDREAAQKEQAIEAFEVRVAKTIELGANDRRQAIWWIMQSMGISANHEAYAYEEMEYEIHLPYGYIAQSLKD